MAIGVSILARWRRSSAPQNRVKPMNPMHLRICMCPSVLVVCARVPARGTHTTMSTRPICVPQRCSPSSAPMHIRVRRKDGMRGWHRHRDTAKHDVSVGGKCWPFTPGSGKHIRAQSCDMRHDQWWEPDQRSVQVPEDVGVGGVSERISEGNFSRVRRIARPKSHLKF